MLKNARRRAATRAKVRRKAKEAKGIKVRDTRGTRREGPREEDSKEEATKEHGREQAMEERGGIPGQATVAKRDTKQEDTKEDGREEAKVTLSQ